MKTDEMIEPSKSELLYEIFVSNPNLMIELTKHDEYLPNTISKMITAMCQMEETSKFLNTMVDLISDIGEKRELQEKLEKLEEDIEDLYQKTRHNIILAYKFMLEV